MKEEWAEATAHSKTEHSEGFYRRSTRAFTCVMSLKMVTGEAARSDCNVFSVFPSQTGQRKYLQILRNMFPQDVDATLREGYLISINALC